MKRFRKTGEDANNVNRLITTLTNAKIATENNALYQTIYGLIKKLSKFEDDTNSSITTIQASISGGSGGGSGGTGNTTASYITENDETADLPNSRQLVAGTNITITPVGITLEVSAAGGVDHVPMATGAEPLEIMSNGAGEVLLIGFTE
jgi:hypothetical protein